MEISQRSSVCHFVSLYGLYVSNHSLAGCVVYHANVLQWAYNEARVKLFIMLDWAVFVFLSHKSAGRWSYSLLTFPVAVIDCSCFDTYFISEGKWLQKGTPCSWDKWSLLIPNPFFKKRFYLFIFRERGREGEREGEKHQCVVAFHAPPTGDLVCNPGMCPDWELSQQPFGSQADPQSTKPYQPGWLQILMCETQ